MPPEKRSQVRGFWVPRCDHPLRDTRVLANMKVQKEKMLAVIERETKLLSGRLVDIDCESPAHCAIGALLAAAGVSDANIDKHRAGDDEVDHFGAFPSGWPRRSRAAVLMREHYGITPMIAGDILRCNDSSESASGIRDRVTRFIRSLPDEIPDVA